MFAVLTGFPPKPIYGSGDDPLTSFGVRSGDVVHVRRGIASITNLSVGSSHARQGSDPEAAARAAKTARIDASMDSSVQQLTAMGFSAAMARKALEVADNNVDAALELCLSGSIPEDLDVEDSNSTAGTAAAAAPVSREEPLHFIRRVINADNSCLFNAIGYVTHRDKTIAPRLRTLIASTVLNDPEQFTEGFLGKPPAEYSTWIKDTSKWGGEIELSILSKHFGVEIAAVDIETSNVYIYGQDQGYSQRVYVLYDGIHYDALARNRSESSSESTDQTKFRPEDDEALEQAKRLAADLKARKQYVNLAGCDLQCLVCGRGLQGQKGALEHAQQTGHQNFGQTAL